jgi:hypothetical protein
LITEKRKTMMASKDNKRKYADGVEDEAEEAPLKKQRTIDNDNDDSSSSDNFLSELEEEVSSEEEEEMNLPAGFEEKLLIQ